MPELPEIETILRGLYPYIIGQTILNVEVRHRYLRWPVDDNIISISNKRVLSITRRAKYLILSLNYGYIIIHFGMSGRLVILSQHQPPEKHDHIDLILSNGYIVRYTDPRRFGAWLWSYDLATNYLLSHLGPEPLSDEFNYRWLLSNLVNKRAAIKTLIMNNKIVVGVGNIYANESLFLAKISPFRSASTLSKQEAKYLVDSIKLVLDRAIEHGGTTLRDFLQSNGQPGCFFHKLLVYGRTGAPCFICGMLIQKAKYRQRSSYYCSNCQN